MKARYLVGIDEAGRGPLAGPVAVGAVCIDTSHVPDVLPQMCDSKSVTENKRSELYDALMSATDLWFTVSMVGAPLIDRKGIQWAIRTALSRCLSKLALHPDETHILLDGALYAPKKYKSQDTIIRGDALEPLIGAASIAAKVTRDRYMGKQHPRYPEYKFHTHKGYGTEIHRRAIQRHGLTPVHRHTYCKAVRST